MVLAFRASPTAMVVTDARLAIVAANAAYERLTGRRAAELLGRLPAVRDAGALATQPLGPVVQRQAAGGREVVIDHRDGRQRRAWMSWTRVPGAHGLRRLFVATFADLGRLQAESERWRHLAHVDALTGLPNRQHLESELARSLARASRHGLRLAVLFIDLDGFKSVNDGLGHAMGDRLLRSVATRLRDSLRAEDFVARYGGDEFVVVLESPQRATDAAAAATTLLDAVADGAATWPAATASITASIGIALYPDHARDATGLLKTADAAMYRAKRVGGNGLAFGGEAATEGRLLGSVP